MSRKDKSSANDKSLTVSEYSRQFFERTVTHGYAEDPEENQRLAGQNFLNLIRKLQEAGSKDDIKVPMRVLRDEIGRIYFGSARQRKEKIETLFKLYDALEAGAQADLQSKEPRQVAAASQVLDELRQRFSRLVIGDTWEAWPELKLIALKRIYFYTTQEGQAAKEASFTSPPPTPSSGGRLGMRKLSRTFSSSSAVTYGSWQATLDDLSKAPGIRLLPLIKLLLANDSEFSDPAREDLAVDPASNGTANKSSEGLRPQASFEGLRPQMSGFSDAPEASRKLGELNMDDLLGLNDPILEEQGSQEASQDPFAANQSQLKSTSEIAASNGYGLAHAPSGSPAEQPGAAAENHSIALPEPKMQSSFPTSPHGIQSQFQSPWDRQPSGTLPADFSSSQTNAFGSQTLLSPRSSAGAPHGRSLVRANSSGTASSQPGGFNPFGLPSPSFATPVGSYVDNSFADYSPVAGAPPPPVPQPMRAPPQPPQPSNAQKYHPQQFLQPPPRA